MVNQRLKNFVNWKVRAGLFCQRYVKSREIEERDGEKTFQVVVDPSVLSHEGKEKEVI